MEFWSSLQSTLESGRSAYVMLVASNTQHSPGTAGAKMFVPQVGEPVGTIGGGGMEHDLVAQARRAIAAKEHTPRVRTLVHKRKPRLGEPSGLICAGQQEHVEFVLRPNDAQLISDIVALIVEDKPGVFWVTPQGFGLTLGSPKPNEAPVVLENGDDFEYREQLLGWRRATIIGGGHCGLALSQTLTQLGYKVSVYDTRPDCPTFRDNMFAQHLIQVDDYVEVGALIRYPQITHVIVMTTDLPSDVRALVGLHGRAFPYIGVMGSPAKISKIKSELSPTTGAAWLDTLFAPIGLPMTSNTPAEIAISIASQLLSLRPALFPHTRRDAP